MSKSLDEKLGEFSPARRKKVDARAAELIADEGLLRDLRADHPNRQTLDGERQSCIAAGPDDRDE